ncbi:phage tail assembly chaperone [Lapidilactobacillus luobeiensis]|uniref:phage tail assembly chaperone n=1 Tax=Lapidilactobacillus luobeiensis TaxID=2950371 RepID=UPI0021C47248|nr:phage tail assembly chaperone [Lapidilactobacillus luobeiensis]
MKIKVKQLGNKSYQVKLSNRNMRSALETQLSLAKFDDMDEDTSWIEQNKQVLATLDMMLDFIREILKLTDKENEKLQELEYQETIEITNYIIARMNGMSDEDLKKAQEVDAQKSSARSGDLGTAEPA